MVICMFAAPMLLVLAMTNTDGWPLARSATALAGHGLVDEPTRVDERRAVLGLPPLSAMMELCRHPLQETFY